MLETYHPLMRERVFLLPSVRGRVAKKYRTVTLVDGVTVLPTVFFEGLFAADRTDANSIDRYYEEIKPAALKGDVVAGRSRYASFRLILSAWTCT